MPCPGKETRYPFYRTLGGPWGWCEWVRTILSVLEFEPQILHPIVNHRPRYISQPHVNIGGAQWRNG